MSQVCKNVGFQNCFLGRKKGKQWFDDSLSQITEKPQILSYKSPHCCDYVCYRTMVQYVKVVSRGVSKKHPLGIITVCLHNKGSACLLYFTLSCACGSSFASVIEASSVPIQNVSVQNNCLASTIAVCSFPEDHSSKELYSRHCTSFGPQQYTCQIWSRFDVGFFIQYLVIANTLVFGTRLFLETKTSIQQVTSLMLELSLQSPILHLFLNVLFASVWNYYCH